MAKQSTESKAILLPISDDGDPFEIGDMVGFDGWDSMATNGMPTTTGSAFLGLIRAINGNDATIEYLNTNMQPRGDTVIRPLAALREYILPGSAEATEVPDSTAGKSAVIEIISDPHVNGAEGVEYKSIVGFKSESINGRTVDGIAAVMGNVDDNNDVTHNGAFRKTIQEQGKRIMFTFNHELLDTPRARIDELKEISRDDLPVQIKNRFPQATGGLFVKRTYLETPRGEEAFQGVVTGAIPEMSYGYQAIVKERGLYEGKSVRNLRQVRLIDICDTTLGVNAATMSKKGALPYQGTPKAAQDSVWDGPAEVAKADVSDLAKMCAWVDPKDKESKSGYKLPHHRADDGHTVVWNGVKAAMGALMGSRDGVDIPEGDRRAVYNHLAKHYEQFGEEPPEYKMLEITYSIKAARALVGAGVDFKTGRMISAANEAKIQDVIDALEKGLETLEDLLGVAESPADEAAEEAADMPKAFTDPKYLLALLDMKLMDIK